MYDCLFQGEDVDLLFDSEIFSNEGFQGSPGQTVPSISPNSSPPYSPNAFTGEIDNFYASGQLFEGINDICSIPMSDVKQEPLKDELSVDPTAVCHQPSSGPVTGKKRTRKALGNGKPDFQSMSSKSLEEYAKQLEATGALTIDEERQLKKQRRLIKNRESAQLSRQRKKQYITDLEQKVRTMTSETEGLKQQVADLTGKNIELENQVAQLKSIVNSIPLKNPKATVGLCVVVFLFSLGLFFNAPTTPSYTNPQLTHPSSVYTGRVLQEVPFSEETTEVEPLLQKRTRDFVFEEDISPKRRPKVEIFEDHDDYDVQEEPFSLTVVENNSPPLLFASDHPDSRLSDTSSYIYCSEAHQLAVPVSQPPPTAEPPTITVLLPSTALNGTIPHLEYLDNPEQSLLEVSCQILNITVYPFYHGVDGSDLPLISS